MKIIDELIDDLSSDNKELSDILIRTKVLAHKLKNQTLIAWINKEVNGYNESDSLPVYRKLSAVVTGVISNGYQRFDNYPIPMMHLEKKTRESFIKMHLDHSIATLEDFVSSENTQMMKHIDPSFYKLFNQNSGNGFFVEYAKSEIHKPQVHESLISIKSKLLDFLLDLNDEITFEDDIQGSKEEIKKTIDNLFNNSVFGDNTTIIVGEGNSQKINIKYSKGNFKVLEELLKKHQLSETYIRELQEIIDDDNPDKTNMLFGEKVKTWVNSMMTKAMENSWEIGLGAAGNLLSEGIKAYYGW